MSAFSVSGEHRESRYEFRGSHSLDDGRYTRKIAEGDAELHRFVDKTMRNFPGANETEIGAFRTYIDEQVATNHAFVDKLLRAKDFQESWRIQAEYCQSQLKAAANNATKLRARISEPFNRSAG